MIMNTRIINTIEATGIDLDYLVAEALKIDVAQIVDNGPLHAFRGADCYPERWAPSTNPAQGQPLIEQYKINVTWLRGEQTWFADAYSSAACHVARRGTTALEAAMRCLAACELPYRVEVPGSYLAQPVGMKEAA